MKSVYLMDIWGNESVVQILQNERSNNSKLERVERV